MRSRGYGLGIIVLLVGACLFGAAPRASAQGGPQPAAVAADEATPAAQNWGVGGPSGGRPWDLGWGVEGGFTYAGISYDNNTIMPSSRWGGVGGVFLDWHRHDPSISRLGYMLDFLYDTKGAKFPYGNTDEILGLKYFEVIPAVNVKLYNTPQWGLHASVGPQIGFRLLEGHYVNDQTINVPDFTKRTDFGISWTVGIDFNSRLSSCFRHTQGFTNIIDNPGTSNLNAHNRAFQLSLRYMF